MTLKSFVKKWYKVKLLEALMIAEAVKSRQWQDFRHTLKDRVVLTIVSLFLKTY